MKAEQGGTTGGHKGKQFARIRCRSTALVLLLEMVKNKKQLKKCTCLFVAAVSEVHRHLKGHSFNQEGHNNTAVLLICTTQCLLQPYQGWQTALAAPHPAPEQMEGVSHRV